MRLAWQHMIAYTLCPCVSWKGFRGIERSNIQPHKCTCPQLQLQTHSVCNYGRNSGIMLLLLLRRGMLLHIHTGVTTVQHCLGLQSNTPHSNQTHHPKRAFVCVLVLAV